MAILNGKNRSFNLHSIIWELPQAVIAFLQVEVVWFGLHTFLQFINQPLKTENIEDQTK
jgi:hypothetical protein